MAYTNLTVENFTLSQSLVLRSKNSPPQNDEAFCEVKKMFIIKMDYLDNDFIFYKKKNLHVHRLVWLVPAHLEVEVCLVIRITSLQRYIVVTSKNSMSLHVYLITDWLNQGLNYFKQKYHLR